MVAKILDQLVESSCFLRASFVPTGSSKVVKVQSFLEKLRHATFPNEPVPLRARGLILHDPPATLPGFGCLGDASLLDK